MSYVYADARSTTSISEDSPPRNDQEDGIRWFRLVACGIVGFTLLALAGSAEMPRAKEVANVSSDSERVAIRATVVDPLAVATRALDLRGVAGSPASQHAVDGRTLAGGDDAIRGNEPAHGGADLIGRMQPRRYEPLVPVEWRSALRPVQSGADQRAAAALWTAYGRMYAQGMERDEHLSAVFQGSSAELARASVYSDWAELLRAWPDWDVSTMLAIVRCESGGHADAVSPPDYDGLRNYGITQNHGDPESLDPVTGVERAHDKFVAARDAGGTGYEPWRGSEGCWG